MIFIVGLFLVGAFVGGKGELAADGLGWGVVRLLFGGLPCVAFSFLLYGIRSLKFRVLFGPILMVMVCGVLLMMNLASAPHVSIEDVLRSDVGHFFMAMLAFGGTFSLHHYLLPRRK